MDTLDTESLLRLMRTLAHDMRGPIGVLTGACDLFAAGHYGDLTPKQAMVIERMGRNSHRLLTTLDDFMAYIKAQYGNYPLSPAPFKPCDIITEIQAQISPTAHEKGIAIQVHHDDAVPATVVGDAPSIRRVILALLWNAVAFSSAGTIQLISEWSTGLNSWCIEVRDSGPGIAEGNVEHIFEPFWQGEQRSQVPTSGFGLGLAMALALTTAMNGTLRLVRNDLPGSTFRLTIPPAE